MLKNYGYGLHLLTSTSIFFNLFTNESSLVELAAFHGLIKCFRFLYINNTKLSRDDIEYYLIMKSAIAWKYRDH